MLADQHCGQGQRRRHHARSAGRTLGDAIAEPCIISTTSILYEPCGATKVKAHLGGGRRGEQRGRSGLDLGDGCIRADPGSRARCRDLG